MKFQIERLPKAVWEADERKWEEQSCVQAPFKGMLMYLSAIRSLMSDGQAGSLPWGGILMKRGKHLYAIH